MSSSVTGLPKTSGAPSIAHNAVSISSATPTLVVAARATRRGVLIQNRGNRDLSIGDSAVTFTNGVFLESSNNSSVFLDTSAAIYAIAASGGAPVAIFLELFD